MGQKNTSHFFLFFFLSDTDISDVGEFYGSFLFLFWGIFRMFAW